MLIAQISDLHAADSASSVAAMRRATAFLSRIRPQTLIFSGDLVEKPTEESYALVKTLLAHSSFPVFMIPGNADERAAMRAAFPEHGYWPQSGPMNFAVDIYGQVRLIGFDVTIDGENHGEATAEALCWLEAECARQPHLPALVMLHQHPFKIGIAELDDAMCRNGEGFADVIGRSEGRIAAIVCGHGHRSVFTTIRNTPTMMCPSLAEANPLMLNGHPEPEATDGPGLLVHQFHEGRLNSHAVSLA